MVSLARALFDNSDHHVKRFRSEVSTMVQRATNGAVDVSGWLNEVQQGRTIIFLSPGSLQHRAAITTGVATLTESDLCRVEDRHYAFKGESTSAFFTAPQETLAVVRIAVEPLPRPAWRSVCLYAGWGMFTLVALFVAFWLWSVLGRSTPGRGGGSGGGGGGAGGGGTRF